MGPPTKGAAIPLTLANRDIVLKAVLRMLVGLSSPVNTYTAPNPQDAAPLPTTDNAVATSSSS